jgi:hypothetical protein
MKRPSPSREVEGPTSKPTSGYRAGEGAGPWSRLRPPPYPYQVPTKSRGTRSTLQTSLCSGVVGFMSATRESKLSLRATSNTSFSPLDCPITNDKIPASYQVQRLSLGPNNSKHSASVFRRAFLGPPGLPDGGEGTEGDRLRGYQVAAEGVTVTP